MICGDCKQDLPVENFHRCNKSKTGYKIYCKACRKVRAKKYYNSEAAAKKYKMNPEYYKEKAKKRRLEKPNEIRLAKKEWKKENRAYYTKLEADRRARKHQASCSWLSKFDNEYINFIYKQGKALNMEVDHIIPLKGKTVCGLHVPWNLQLLTPKENRAKSNKLLTGGGLSEDF